jgi:CheY-like chemotaxis protein
VPQTLLLADDSITIQRVIELTFADEDIDVVAVSDGDQAIARLESLPPDIVLVDVGMPGKSGYEVAAYVKQSPKLSHIPVVLLTGAFEPVDEAKAVDAGCDGVLAKPFEPQLVIGRVKELLGRPLPARDVTAYEATVDAPLATDGPTDSNKAIDDYFEQLDAAFSNLSSRTSQSTAAVAPEIDWFGLKHAIPLGEPETPTVPLEAAPDGVFAQPAPEPVFAPPTPEPVFTQPAPVPEPLPVQEPAPSAAPPSPALPALADAFATLLEAEQNDPQSAPVSWPASPAAPTAAPATISDELVSRVSARVLERLTDRVVRETVSEIAERLVREEIERIKKGIA